MRLATPSAVVPGNLIRRYSTVTVRVICELSHKREREREREVVTSESSESVLSNPTSRANAL
jgi:hypothetical protein